MHRQKKIEDVYRYIYVEIKNHMQYAYGYRFFDTDSLYLSIMVASSLIMILSSIVSKKFITGFDAENFS